LRWICGRGVESETLGREPDDAPEDEAWLASPLYQLVKRQERMLRRRIDAVSIAEFPILAEFAAMGGVDYVAMRQPIGRAVAFARWTKSSLPGSCAGYCRGDSRRAAAKGGAAG
jgi:hypothetical protein